MYQPLCSQPPLLVLGSLSRLHAAHKRSSSFGALSPVSGQSSSPVLSGILGGSLETGSLCCLGPPLFEGLEALSAGLEAVLVRHPEVSAGLPSPYQPSSSSAGQPSSPPPSNLRQPRTCLPELLKQCGKSCGKWTCALWSCVSGIACLRCWTLWLLLLLTLAVISRLISLDVAGMI